MMTQATITRRASARETTKRVVRPGSWAICAFSGPSRLSLVGLDCTYSHNPEGQKAGPGG